MKKNIVKTIIGVVAIVLVLSFGLISCKTATGTAAATTVAAEATSAAAAETTAAATEEVVAESNETYTFATVLTTHPYFIDSFLGLDAAAAELGVKTKVIGPVEYDVAGMITAMEAEIALKPAGMLVVGWDAALADTINKVMDAGIPAVTIDADVPASNRYTFIGTGNYLAGVESAKILGKLLGGKGKVSASYNPSLSNVSERAKGFKEYIAANFPDMKVIADIDSQSDSALCAKAAAAVIQANPDLAGIACFDATAPLGVATAVKEAGLTGKILIGGVDRNTTDLDMIKEGVISYSIVQKTALMSYLGVKLLYDLNHRPLPIVNDNAAAKMVPLPAVVDTGTSVIDKNNVDLFYPVK